MIITSRIWKFLKKEVDYQVERYRSTKYGKLFAFFIYILLFTFIPMIIRGLVSFLRNYFSDQQIYIILIVLAVSIVTIAWNVIMWSIYVGKVPFFEQYRCNPQKLWPWEQDKYQWRKTATKSILLTSFSVLVVAPILLYLDVTLSFHVIMDINNTPSVIQMLPHFIFFQIMEDIMFFGAHRLLHFPFLYKFHKVHHEYKVTVTIAALHSHLIEFLISNALTEAVYMQLAAELIGPIHINVRVIWTVLKVWEAYNGHCGYMFSWAPLYLIPFSCADGYHDFHHTANCGNYAGVFRILDSIFGYNDAFWEFKAKQKIGFRKESVKKIA